MKVRTNARSQSGVFIEVEVEDADVRHEIEGWDEMKSAQRYRALAQRADLFVLDYLRSRGEITEEYFVQRAAEIKGKS